jgi:hypothetical protein
MERRRFPRYPFVAYAEVTDMNPPHVRIKARTSDLGREGCYVDTITPFDTGTQVLVKIMKNQQTFKANGVVVYSTVGMGMGVRFASIEPPDVLVIEGWMEVKGEIPPELIETYETRQLLDQLEDILEKLSMKRRY